jgi:hypothetical protein
LAQFDDLLVAPAFALQSVSVPGEDDEYLPIYFKEQRKHFGALRQ